MPSIFFSFPFLVVSLLVSMAILGIIAGLWKSAEKLVFFLCLLNVTAAFFVVAQKFPIGHLSHVLCMVAYIALSFVILLISAPPTRMALYLYYTRNTSKHLS